MSRKESWGSRAGLVLAMAGNAVGLGNFLRFPVQAVQNGGGTFMIPYLVCFLLMGVPLLFVEWSMGRFSGQYGDHSAPFILQRLAPRRQFWWKYVGVFGIFTNLTVAGYYSYVESWTLSYVWHSISGVFQGRTADEIAAFFNNYVLHPGAEALLWWLLCLLLNVWVLSRGLKNGVEAVAKIAMPLLVLFGLFLAFKGLTVQAGVDGARFSSAEGLNFLWTPAVGSTIWDPKIWIAAAGQIFFTLSVGMGSVQCYASYMGAHEDVALNAMSAGWMNEFVEVCLGAAIVIPISVGYFGVDWVVENTRNGGLGLGFRTLPYLFQQWGPAMALLSGMCWFGLLFFAGITSSLAMGMSIMGFLEDEFQLDRLKSACLFGLAAFVLGLPTVLFFSHGVFDEFDYWAGTVSLVVFAMFEMILFAWVFGMDKGWREITAHADIQVPLVFKFIIKWVTPTLLLLVFVGAFFKPENNDWHAVLQGQWVLDDGSVVHQILNTRLKKAMAAATDAEQLQTMQEQLNYVNLSRLLLAITFAGVWAMVYVAYQKRLKKEKQA
ncbi:MAG: sodium-dependent transporter [Bacteroidetes bacterium]|nr:sodium-dependent transporter [Bacteroidota bacterium]